MAAALLLVLPSIVLGASVTVAAENFRFAPTDLALAAGDTVVWTFSGEPHTVTSGTPGAPDGRFDSGIIRAGGSYAHRFDAPGSYPYFCAIHPEDMVGAIVVMAAATPVPTRPPTPRPTPQPTQRPTVSASVSPRPAATPRPTVTGAATRTATPAPTSSGIPAASSVVTPSAPTGTTPAATATPADVATTRPSRPPAHTDVPVATPAPEPAAGVAGTPAMLAIAGVLLAVVLAGAVVAARARSRPR